MNVSSKYPNCDHLKEKQHKLPINKELRTSLSRNFRVLPLYEKAISDHEFSRRHSLKDNQFLQCRWEEYQRVHIAQKPEPFEFPHINDYHFFNYHACYKPDLSVNPESNHRFWLKMGPGVDQYGEMPIPSDVGFRKTGLMVEKKKRMKMIKNR